MALSNAQYNSIMRSYEETQYANKRLSDARLTEVFSKVDGFREVHESILNASHSLGERYIEGEKDALAELKETISHLIEMKQDLLVGAGYPATYLDPIYTCEDCKDTGYINGQKCHCFKQQIVHLLYEQSGLDTYLQNQSFDKFSLSYFEGDTLSSFSKILSISKDFVNSFDKDYRNLFFYGTVGTGKSFLSGCIANELIRSGHQVIYISSANLSSVLSDAMFHHDKDISSKATCEDLYSCDLLIIDDLGTEFTNSVTVSQFFSLINGRILNSKSTLISTNLSLEDLRDRYSDRIFSRITDKYTILKFQGPDVRMIRSMENSRK